MDTFRIDFPSSITLADFDKTSQIYLNIVTA